MLMQANDIQTLKRQLALCPHPDSNSSEFSQLKSFFFTLRDYMDNPQDDEREAVMTKCLYHLEKLWQHLLNEFMSPMWAYDEKGYNEAQHKRYALSGRIDVYKLKELLQMAVERQEMVSFFRAFPYAKALLIIDRWLSNQPLSQTDKRVLAITLQDYFTILPHYDTLQPLLVLREHLRLMMNHPDFDALFYQKYMRSAGVSMRDRARKPETDVIFLSMFIAKYISYDMRQSEGFKRLNWGAFDGLFRAMFSHPDILPAADVMAMAQSMEAYISALLQHELGTLSVDQLPAVDLSRVAEINWLENVSPAKTIVSNYVSILNQITTDSETSRCAILRAMTAIGEAVKSILPLLPADKQAEYQLFIRLRDNIIHAASWSAYQCMNDLTRDTNNTQVIACQADLPLLENSLNQLFEWLDTDRDPNQCPSMPPLPAITQLDAVLTAASQQDDRDEHVPVALRLKLAQSLPDLDQRANPYYQSLKSFILCHTRMSRDDFKLACPQLTATEAKKLHDKLCERKKIRDCRQCLNRSDFDFSRVSFNLKKAQRSKLKAILKDENKQELVRFMDEHEQSLGLTPAVIDQLLEDGQIIELAEFKAILQQFMEYGVQDGLKKDRFEKAVNVMFYDDPIVSRCWMMAYALQTTQEMLSVKRFQLATLDHALENLARLRRIMSPIFDGHHVDVMSNPLVAIASEMAFGFCLDSFKRIKSHLSALTDYSDRSLLFFATPHPIHTVRELLDTVIVVRNDIFHFDRFFLEPITLDFLRMIWFSVIQNLVHGLYFPEAIVITDTTVTREAMMSNPTQQALTRLRDLIAKDLPRDEHQLNVYQAEIKDLIESQETNGLSKS